MDEHAAEYEAEFNRKRGLDRRRETSRFAARDRRGKEANVFTDLKEVVPIVDEATVTHVDRIALLRVASTLCRLREFAAQLLKTNDNEERERVLCERTVLESLDGFLMIVDLDGTILYVTESVSIYLGLTQTDLTGRSLREFVHAKDYDEFATCDSGSTDENEIGRMLTLRMKSVISPRGRNLNYKSALMKPVTCHVRSMLGTTGRIRVVVAIAQPAGQASSITVTTKSVEIPCGTYMTRHTCDMKFSYVSESFNYILRREARSLMGTSFYNLIYPSDLNVVIVSFREMLEKGYTRTPYYRLIGINKSVLWVQTEATVVNHTTKGHRGQYVICIHDFLGSQAEIESFVGEESDLMQMKQEIDRPEKQGIDLTINNYNGVLHWLIRAQKHTDSPSRTVFRTQSNGNRNASESAECATEIQTINYGKKNVLGTDNHVQENCSNSSYADNGESESETLVTTADPCRTRTSNTRTNCSGGTVNAGSRNCTSYYLQADIPSNATAFSTLRLPTLPATDAYVLPNSNIANGGESVGGTERNRGNMLTTLLATGSQYASSVNYEPGLTHISSPLASNISSLQSNLPTNPMNSATEMLRIAQNKENGNDDNWQLLAPYVAHDDLMLLSTDLQGLLPDFDLLDWIPSDPAPLPTLPSKERDVILEENMDFDVNAGIIPLSKPNCLGITGLDLSPQKLTPIAQSTAATATVKELSFGVPKTKSTETNSVSTSWRQFQQQRMQQQQSAITNSGTAWAGYGTASFQPNSQSVAFRRSGSVVQQGQRV